MQWIFSVGDSAAPYSFWYSNEILLSSSSNCCKKSWYVQQLLSETKIFDGNAVFKKVTNTSPLPPPHFFTDAFFLLVEKLIMKKKSLKLGENCQYLDNAKQSNNVCQNNNNKKAVLLFPHSQLMLNFHFSPQVFVYRRIFLFPQCCRVDSPVHSWLSSHCAQLLPSLPAWEGCGNNCQKVSHVHCRGWIFELVTQDLQFIISLLHSLRHCTAIVFYN